MRRLLSGDKTPSGNDDEIRSKLLLLKLRMSRPGQRNQTTSDITFNLFPSRRSSSSEAGRSVGTLWSRFRSKYSLFSAWMPSKAPWMERSTRRLLLSTRNSKERYSESRFSGMLSMRLFIRRM